MTYEQSLKNIELLKSFGSPLDDCFLFFHFQNNTEFIPMFISKKHDRLTYKNYENLRMEAFRKNLPLGLINLNENYNLKLDYVDMNLSYTFNLTKNITLVHSSTERPRGSSSLKNDFLKLITLLKNK